MLAYPNILYNLYTDKMCWIVKLPAKLKTFNQHRNANAFFANPVLLTYDYICCHVSTTLQITSQGPQVLWQRTGHGRTGVTESNSSHVSSRSRHVDIPNCRKFKTQFQSSLRWHGVRIELFSKFVQPFWSPITQADRQTDRYGSRTCVHFTHIVQRTHNNA